MRKKKQLSRRGFFRSAFAGAAAFSAGGYLAGPQTALPTSSRPRQEENQDTPGYGDYLKDQDQAHETLSITEDNIEGPFFRPNAPFRTVLYEKGARGNKYTVFGKVKARNGRPLTDALVEVWQADDRGRYDNDDPANPPARGEFRLRARIRANEKGEYQFETIRPGQYRISRTQVRPAHIHIKVHRKGCQSLTTQLYFEDDRFNKTDPWFKPGLVVKYRENEKPGKFRGEFNFVLPRN